MGGNEYERESLEELHYYVNDDNSAYIGPPALAEIEVEGDLFNHLGAQVGGLFGELILVLFVMFVLW